MVSISHSVSCVAASGSMNEEDEANQEEYSNPIKFGIVLQMVDQVLILLLSHSL